MKQRNPRGLGFAALLVASLVVVQSASAADGPRLRWRRQAGIFLSDVAVDRQGSIFVVGSRGSASGEPALLVKKLTPAGQPVWSRTWRPTTTRARGAGIAIGPDGSVYVVGALECRVTLG